MLRSCRAELLAQVPPLALHPSPARCCYPGCLSHATLTPFCPPLSARPSAHCPRPVCPPQLRSVFGFSGKITALELTGPANSFAFVEYETPGMASAALAMNGVQVGRLSSPTL